LTKKKKQGENFQGVLRNLGEEITLLHRPGCTYNLISKLPKEQGKNGRTPR